MEMATCVWHHDVVDREKAMTKLLEAVADVKAQPDRVARLAAALYEASKAGERQRDLVRATGFTRETIRRHIEDEKIRRGEMDPTPRYLAAQRRAASS
jgi:predicted transcriptional regulator